jgi:hypothetical protein
MRGRPAEGDYTPVTVAWLLSLGLALAATAPWPWPSASEWWRLVRARALPRADWLLMGALLVAALLLRVVGLEQYPYTYGGDEGSQAVSAVGVLDGRVTNPFGTGWYSVPNMFFYWQAWSIRLFGDSVAGVRTITGIIGALAVVATYVYARRQFGRGVALVAATLLAVFHYHILFSRLSSVQVTDSLFVVLALFLLDRALYERRPFDALLAGLAIGYSQYFHFGARVLPFVALACIVYAMLSSDGGFRLRLPPPAAWRPLLPVAGWIALGGVLTYLPLFAYYLDHSKDFVDRVQQVNMFTNGWLTREQQITGQGPVPIVLFQIWRSIMLPFDTPPGGWYVGLRPIIGLPMAVPTAIGLLITTLSALRRQYFGLAVAYWGTIIGLGLTDEPWATQRFVIATSLIAVLAAIGITFPLRFASFLLAVPRAVTAATIAVIVAVLAIWNLNYTFLTPNHTDRYGTANGLVATELAYYLRSLGPGYDVYFFAPPRMYYYGFSTLPFIARDDRGVDVDRPLTPDAPPLPVVGPTVFAFLPERLAELQQVRGWYPNGELHEIRDPRNNVLLVAYRVAGR